MAVLACLGCGRFGYEPAGGDGAPGSDGGVRAWDGDFAMEAPQRLAISGPGLDSECFITPDELTITFASEREGGFGFHDLYAASRDAPGAEFADVVHLDAMSTGDAEGRLATYDGLHAFFWTTRPPSAMSDLWSVNRASTGAEFDGADAAPVTELVTADNEFDPWPSRDGLRIYYLVTGQGGDANLAVAERETTTTPFGEPVQLDEINSPVQDDNPAVSADERFIVFASARPGSAGLDLYYARRADRTSPFGPAEPLTELNTAVSDTEPCITESGEIVFSRGDGDAGTYDLYRSRFIAVE